MRFPIPLPRAGRWPNEASQRLVEAIYLSRTDYVPIRGERN